MIVTLQCVVGIVTEALNEELTICFYVLLRNSEQLLTKEVGDIINVHIKIRLAAEQSLLTSLIISTGTFTVSH